MLGLFLFALNIIFPYLFLSLPFSFFSIYLFFKMKALY
ncbi:hypothetical protein BACI9J_140208 [Bacillus altitudinis]|nr:hypothetical protein BACI9J_140208 [Bacillus altitudinis]